MGLADVVPSSMPMSLALEMRQRKRTLHKSSSMLIPPRIVAADEDPTLHEEAQPIPGELTDDLPSLVPSTNPLFPNAVVKKPPNTHAKASQSRHPQEKKGPSTPRIVTGKNAPVGWRFRDRGRQC